MAVRVLPGHELPVSWIAVNCLSSASSVRQGGVSFR